MSSRFYNVLIMKPLSNGNRIFREPSNPRLKTDVENARLLGLAFSPRLSRMALDFFLTER